MEPGRKFQSFSFLIVLVALVAAFYITGFDSEENLISLFWGVTCLAIFAFAFACKLFDRTYYRFFEELLEEPIRVCLFGGIFFLIYGFLWKIGKGFLLESGVNVFDFAALGALATTVLVFFVLGVLVVATMTLELAKSILDA